MAAAAKAAALLAAEKAYQAKLAAAKNQTTVAKNTTIVAKNTTTN